jgi:hypothetical protein
MERTERERDLYEAVKGYVSMAERIRETGILTPEDAADIAHGLAFLHGQIAWMESKARRHSR